jgi:hypothetical protein
MLIQFRTVTLRACVLSLLVATSVHAQGALPDPNDPNPGAITLTAAVDTVSTYMFRGIRQNSTGIAMQPYVDVGVALFSGDGMVKSVGLNVGTWNSLHDGDTGANAASRNMWYESDFYSTLSAGVGGATISSTFTAYTSPNAGFSTVREIAFRLGFDDSPFMGSAALRPYALVAAEFLTDPGVGQADGGDKAGKYLEVGVAPSYTAGRATLALPLKVGVSLGDYYELRNSAGTVVKDTGLGFVSVAATATVPIGGASNFGGFNIHGGVEFQRLGDATRASNGGDENKVIGSIGLGLSY